MITELYYSFILF